MLRAIAIDRGLHFLVLAALAAAVFLFASNATTLREQVLRVLGALQGGLGGPTSDSDGGFVDRIDQFLKLPRTSSSSSASRSRPTRCFSAPRRSGSGCRAAGPST